MQKWQINNYTDTTVMTCTSMCQLKTVKEKRNGWTNAYETAFSACIDILYNHFEPRMENTEEAVLKSVKSSLKVYSFNSFHNLWGIIRRRFCGANYCFNEALSVRAGELAPL